MKTLLKLINGAGFISAALLLCGCGTVYSPVPVGEPVDLSGEVEKWEGTWMQDGEVSFTVKVLDAKRGFLQASSVDPEEDEVIDVWITGHDDWMFVNLAGTWGEVDEEEDKTKKYTWGRIVKEDRVALVYVPDDRKFVELVRAGVLPGTVGDGGDPKPGGRPDVHLDVLDSSHLDRIVSKTNDLLFVWDDPMVYMRVDQMSGSDAEEPDDVVTNATSSLEVLSIHPGAQATLNAGDKVTVKIRYSRAGEETVRVWAQPHVKNRPAASDGFYSASQPEPAGEGTLERSLGFNGPVVLDEIRIKMVDAESRKTLAEIFHPVNLTWEGTVPKPETIAPVGEPFPELKFTSIQGEEIDIAALKGKVVLIDFWATWCGPCIAEMPELLAAHKDHRDQGFEIVGISLDQNREKLENYIQQNDVPWPQYFDGKGWGNAIVERFAIRGIPFTFLIDRDGVVRHIGLRGKELLDTVQEML